VPYIKQSERENLRQFLTPLCDHIENESYDCNFEVGHLNYVFTVILQAFLKCGGKVTPCYSDLNGAIGALEACKLEMVRRMVNPYEDKKISESGDVY